MNFRNILAVSFLVIVYQALAQQPEELKNKIIWDEGRSLTWNDFKGKANEQSKFYAQTCSGIYYKVQQRSQTEFSVFVETFFDPAESWKKSKLATDYLLVHEQRHFDIYELYTRLFVKAVVEMKFNDENKVFSQLREAYRKVNQDAMEFSDSYDMETVHSTVEEQQKLWNEEIDRLLEESKSYDLKEIRVQVF